MIRLIATVDCNFGISKNGKILWSFFDDLKFFQKNTINDVVVMGRNTFFSIKNRPLKNRINWVISKNLEPTVGIEVFHSFDEVLSKCDNFWIIGGEQLYNYVLRNNFVDYAIITIMHENYDSDKFIDFSNLEKFSQKIIFSCSKYSIIEYSRN